MVIRRMMLPFGLSSSRKNAMFAILVCLLFVTECSFANDERCSKPECINVSLRQSGPFTTRPDETTEFKIFCFEGLPRKLAYLWCNPVLKVKRINSGIVVNQNGKFLTYIGDSVSSVKQLRSHQGYSFLQTFLSTLRSLKQDEDFSLTAFNRSCIGIETNTEYTASLKVKVIEIWFLAYLALGIVLFFSARSWSHNTSLHYGTGVSVGIMASLLILIFILSRFLPQRLKYLGYLLLVLGSSTSVWLISSFTHLLSDPVTGTIIEYWQYILGYCVLMGVVSFAIVYRYGPVTDPRTLNLIQWLLQGIGLVLVYNSTQLREVSIALIIILVTVYNFPRAMLTNQRTRNLWYRFFPPKIKLLSDEEYRNQGDEETQKALEQLREYCRSPDCKTWKIVSKLKSPQRFAEFVEGDSWHVTNEELLEYDSGPDPTPPHLISDDEEEEEMDFILSSQ